MAKGLIGRKLDAWALHRVDRNVELQEEIMNGWVAKVKAKSYDVKDSTIFIYNSNVINSKF